MADTVEKPVSGVFANVIAEIDKTRHESLEGGDYEAGYGAGIDRALEIVRAGDAEYRARLTTSTTEALASLRRAGLKYSGNPPYGRKVAADGRTLIDNRRELEAITRARQLRADGESLRAISVSLKRDGFLARSGQPFDSTQIRRMVNGALRGKL